MGDNNLETRVAILETDVKYLKDGHAEMKTIIKGLEGVPYDIRGVSQKLDTVIEQQKEMKKEVKEEIKDIESRIDCLEDEPKIVQELPTMMGVDRTKMYEFIKWGVSIALIILGIAGRLLGIDIGPMGGM
ncbi:hypothetical protein [Deinococcus sp. Leaf326]|uniref:hypothetical protein n=1 Tax=Deinococcus sp. Leaf326 TaxID=1736338 RepID=UPI000A723B6B|nr:hypothetical protein [Deinococcus sp. Leaf326]